MAARTLGIVVAIAMLAALPARAQSDDGDIVDQILRARGTAPPAAASPAITINPAAIPAPAPVSTPPAAAASIDPPAAPPIALTAPGLTAPAAPANAAPGEGDIVGRLIAAPQPSPFGAANATSWTGFYAGLDLGGGTTAGGSGESCANSNTGTSHGCVVVGNGGFSTNGEFGGLTFGYLQTIDLNLGLGVPLIIGAEANLDPSGVSGKQNVGGPFSVVDFPALICSPCSYAASQRMDWLGSIRARAGVPIGDVLVYGTAGLMFGGATVSQDLVYGTRTTYTNTAKATLNGPTVGGGAEIALPTPWPATLKAEALYYDLGNLQSIATSVNGSLPQFSDTKSFGFHGAIFRIGVNFRLGNFPGH